MARDKSVARCIFAPLSRAEGVLAHDGPSIRLIGIFFLEQIIAKFRLSAPGKTDKNRLQKVDTVDIRLDFAILECFESL